MPIADDIAKQQMMPNEEDFFKRYSSLPLPEVIASDEFKSMPLAQKRKVMDLFDQQAREMSFQETMTGTNALSSLLSMLVGMRGIGSALTMPGKLTSWEQAVQSMRPIVPKGSTVIMP